MRGKNTCVRLCRRIEAAGWAINRRLLVKRIENIYVYVYQFIHIHVLRYGRDVNTKLHLQPNAQPY